MAVPKNVIQPSPYAATSTEAAWKAAKTGALRDKWNTDLSAALKAAKTAYDLVDFEKVDLPLYRAQHGRGQTLAELEQLKKDAQAHVVAHVLPAIKALDKAKKLATAAGTNLVISKAANIKAKAIALDLGRRLTQLQGIDYDDYDAEISSTRLALDRMFKDFDDDLTQALARAKVFIAAVRATPTAVTFNQSYKTAARDVTQQLANVPKLQKNGYRLVQTDPQHVVDGLEDWAEERRHLKPKATAVQVNAEVKLFEKAIQAVRDWRL